MRAYFLLSWYRASELAVSIRINIRRKPFKGHHFFVDFQTDCNKFLKKSKT